MLLAEKKCIACQGGIPPLPKAEAERLLKDIPGWNLSDDGLWLKRKFTFSNWAKTFTFLEKVSVIAESEKHHPDIAFGWGYCEISVQTHKIGGLHENDFILAAKINAIN